MGAQRRGKRVLILTIIEQNQEKKTTYRALKKNSSIKRLFTSSKTKSRSQVYLRLVAAEMSYF